MTLPSMPASGSQQPPPSSGRRPGRLAARWWHRLQPRLMPYWLLAPALLILGVGLLYPIYRLGIMSTQEFGLRQQFGAPPPSVGLDNFRTIFGDSYFWTVLRRSLIFAAVNVGLTMLLGTLIALLMTKLAKVLRFGVSVALLLAWATPPLTSTIVWQWMFDTRFGVVNWLLGDERAWLSEPFTFFMVATIIVVWMGVPFVTMTLYAALIQIPDEVVEAAKMDGANAWQRFRDVIWPGIKPVFIVMAALSTLWDLRVFTQIYVLQQAGGLTRETNLLGTWAFRTSGQHFGEGAAIALVLVAITLSATLVYIRQMFRQEAV